MSTTPPPSSSPYLPLILYGVTVALLWAIQGTSSWWGSLYPTAVVLALVLPAGGWMVWRDEDFVEYGLRFDRVNTQILWALGGTASILGLYLAATWGYSRYTGQTWFHSSNTAWHKWIYLHLFLVALPEEFLFRGYLQTQWNKHRPHQEITGIIAVSLLFAVAHIILAGHISRVLVFFPSLAFGYLRHRTESIWPSTFLHGMSNVVYVYFPF